jgi:hypothetical protein
MPGSISFKGNLLPRSYLIFGMETQNGDYEVVTKLAMTGYAGSALSLSG